MHYAIAVVTKDGDYESALAPYNSALEVELHRIRTRAEVIKEKRESLAKWKPGDEAYEYLIHHFDFSSDDALLESIKKSMEYDTYTKFDSNGDLFSTYNPKSLWDWYDVGGRYTGSLVLRKGFDPEYEEDMRNNGEFDQVVEDEAKVKDIDFVKTCSVTPERIEYGARFWDVYVEGKPLKRGEKPGDYEDIIKKSWYRDTYGNKQTYLNSLSAFPVYAILGYDKIISQPKDDIFDWVEEKEGRTYQDFLDEMSNYISHLDPEDWISIIDCHI